MADVKYADMGAGEMLEALGDDAWKWAEALAEHQPGIDQEMLMGWFANAIENSWELRCRRLAKSDQAWADHNEKIGRMRSMYCELELMNGVRDDD